jgi:hypothetical protein
MRRSLNDVLDTVVLHPAKSTTVAPVAPASLTDFGCPPREYLTTPVMPPFSIANPRGAGKPVYTPKPVSDPDCNAVNSVLVQN